MEEFLTTIGKSFKLKLWEERVRSLLRFGNVQPSDAHASDVGWWRRISRHENHVDQRNYSIATGHSCQRWTNDSQQRSSSLHCAIVRLDDGIESPLCLSSSFGSYRDRQYLYLSMEYLPGGELFSYFRRERRFKQAIVRFYACEIILALEYLHDCSIVYRSVFICRSLTLIFDSSEIWNWKIWFWISSAIWNWPISVLPNTFKTGNCDLSEVKHSPPL